MKMTPTEALTYQAQTRPESPAFIFENEIWSYKALLDEVERLARSMAGCNVKKGDRVALHLMNRPEMIVAYYACFKIGAIAAPLRTALKFAELAPLVRRLAPALYIGESYLYENIAELDPAILAIDKRLIVGNSSTKRWEGFLEGAKEARSPVDGVSNDPAVLITTSGTTGGPKFVVHTADTLAESASMIIANWGMSTDERLIVPQPLAHMSGLACFLAYVQFGTPFVLLRKFDAGAVLDAIERHSCTRYLGFPVDYAELTQSQQLQPRDLSSLRLCLTGADVCPIDLQERVRSVLGVPLYNLWGATEVVGTLTFGLENGPVVRATNGASVRLVDERGVDVPHGEAGELLIRGPNVFVGYWNDSRATEESLKDGWYRTGDLMRRGDGDDLWFVGRKKDIIIRGGTNISPVEIERALVACHPMVDEAAVVGVPDEVLGERVFAFVTLSNCSATIASDILSRVGKLLASYKVPENLRIMDQLPRSTLGKVDRNALRALIAKPKTNDPTGRADEVNAKDADEWSNRCTTR
jgi:long-chain acyl-CoA synthetase